MKGRFILPKRVTRIPACTFSGLYWSGTIRHSQDQALCYCFLSEQRVGIPCFRVGMTLFLFRLRSISHSRPRKGVSKFYCKVRCFHTDRRSRASALRLHCLALMSISKTRPVKTSRHRSAVLAFLIHTKATPTPQSVGVGTDLVWSWYGDGIGLNSLQICHFKAVHTVNQHPIFSIFSNKSNQTH